MTYFSMVLSDISGISSKYCCSESNAAVPLGKQLYLVKALKLFWFMKCTFFFVFLFLSFCVLLNSCHAKQSLSKWKSSMKLIWGSTYLKLRPYSLPFPFLPVFSGEDARSGCVLLGLGEFLISQSQTSHLSWHFHPFLHIAALCSPRRYLQLGAKDKMTEVFLKKIQFSGLAPDFLLSGMVLGTKSLLQMFQELLLLTLAALGFRAFCNISNNSV